MAGSEGGRDDRRPTRTVAPWLLVACAMGALAAACGLTVVGERVTTSVPDAEPPVAPSLPEGAAPVDGGVDAPTDGATDADATSAVDAGPPTLFVVSATRFLTLDAKTRQWDGGTVMLPAGTCPAFDEVALDGAGVLYGTAGNQLLKITDATPTCTVVAPNVSGLPAALGVAPRGTLDANAEALVGYRGNGDYVRVDPAAGTVTVVAAGALGGFNVGDVANVGTKGYVAMTGSACGIIDCIWAVDLATGLRIGMVPNVVIPSVGHLRALAHWSGVLYAFSDKEEAFAVDPIAGTFVPITGSGIPTIAYRGAASSPNAPTQ